MDFLNPFRNIDALTRTVMEKVYGIDDQIHVAIAHKAKAHHAKTGMLPRHVDIDGKKYPVSISMDAIKKITEAEKNKKVGEKKDKVDTEPSMEPVREEEELTESHYKVGDRVQCLRSGMVGTVTKLDKPHGDEDEKYYTVKLDNGKMMKYAPNELKAVKEMKEQVKPEVEKSFPATGVKKNPPMKGVSTMPKDKERRGPTPAGGSMKEEAEEIEEAVTVSKKDYSWGKMMTVHHGNEKSYPLHPQHQSKIKGLDDGEKTSFKDETGATVHAERQGDMIHLSGSGSNKKTPIARKHFTEETSKENNSNLSSILKNKLSDEGGAAAFDVLKDAAKKININLTPEMLKGISGIKLHRDGDYILENINEATPTKQQVKQAIGIARDKRYAGGNMTGAVKAMDKVNKGLAQHPSVKKELQKQNEDVELEEALRHEIAGAVGQFIGNKIDPVHGDIMRVHGKEAYRQAAFHIRKTVNDVKDAVSSLHDRLHKQLRTGGLATEEVENMTENVFYNSGESANKKPVGKGTIVKNTRTGIVGKAHSWSVVQGVPHLHVKSDNDSYHSPTKDWQVIDKKGMAEEVELDEGKYGAFRVGPKRPKYPYVPQGLEDPRTGLPLGFSPAKDKPKESEPKKTKNEDVKLNELSRETIGSYVNKASDARGHKNLSTAKVDKRMSGIAKASSRLDKMDEDAELEEMSDAQMKRREDIAKSMNDADFKRRYGKDWMQVKMATATKMAQKEERELGEQEKKLFPGTPEYKKKFDPSYNPYDPQGKEKARLKLSPYGYRDRDDKKKKEVDELREPDEKKKKAAYTNLNHPDMEYHKGINIHNCATKVYSEQWGEGMPIKTMHAEPDADGNIAWYDIMFDHGIEKQVSITEMKIVASEMHYHKKNK